MCTDDRASGLIYCAIPLRETLRKRATVGCAKVTKKVHTQCTALRTDRATDSDSYVLLGLGLEGGGRSVYTTESETVCMPHAAARERQARYGPS